MSLLSDTRKIKAIYLSNGGENGAWIVGNAYIKTKQISTYLESDGAIWFAIFTDDGISYRVNSRFIESIEYFRDDEEEKTKEKA